MTKPLGIAPASDAVEAARNGHLIGLAASTKPSPSGISSPPLDHPSQQEVSSLSSRPVGSEEFALQPISTLGPPIPVRRSKRAGGSRFQPNTGPSTVLSRYRNRIGIGIILVGLLSLIGAGTFYFMSQQNNLAGILDDSGSGVLLPNEDTQQKAQDTEPKSENIPEESTERAKREPEPKTESPLEKPADVKLRLHVRIEEILENAPVVSEVSRHVADIEIENGTPDILELIAGGEHFELVQSKLLLKHNETGFDFEKDPSLTTQLRAAEKVVDVKIPIKNIDEPNLKLAIKDSNQNHVSSVREGNKLFSHVENADPDENGSRQFEWEGLQEDGKWVVFSSGKNYTDDAKHLAKYLKVRCKLTYGSSIPSPSTVSYSDDLRVLKIGTARILLAELLMNNKEKPPVIQIELPIDELPTLKGKSEYRVMIGTAKVKLLKGNQHISAAIPLDSDINNFKGFAMPKALRSDAVNAWLYGVHRGIEDFYARRKEMLDELRSMNCRLSLALRDFIDRGIPSNQLPLHDLVDQYSEVHKWLNDLEKFQQLEGMKELRLFENRVDESKREEDSQSVHQARKFLEKMEADNPQQYKNLLNLLFTLESLRKNLGPGTLPSKAIPEPLQKFFELAPNKLNTLNAHVEVKTFFVECKSSRINIPNKFKDIWNSASNLQSHIRNASAIEVVVDSTTPVVISIIKDPSNQLRSTEEHVDKIDLQFRVAVVGLKPDPKIVPDLTIPQEVNAPVAQKEEAKEQ
jgi:hypothetical protein